MNRVDAFGKLNVVVNNAGIFLGKGERIRMLHPIERTGGVQDIANAVLYLASDESSFVTCSELVVDGGFTAQ